MELKELKPGDTEPTKLLSTFMTRMGEQNGYLVRLHPVAIGEGIITLPEKNVVLGRDGDCEIVLADQDVSRRHATIEIANQQYVVKDMGSTNGTMVNDQIVDRWVLNSGDQIRVGKTILKFLRGNNIEKQYHETVYSMMINDGLTGVPNKRYFLEALQRELIRSQRHNRPLSLAVLDIDHFKKINDTYGHLAGDSVLRELSGRISKAVRQDELFARYGGEEFVVLLPEAGIEDAARFGERIRELVANQPMTIAGATIAVTVSIGVAHTAGENQLTAGELFSRADTKLYAAKAGGRNRVVSV